MARKQVERRKLTELIPDAHNANRGTERGAAMLEDSLSQVGIGRGVVVDKNGVLIAGNKTHEQAVERGFEDAILVHTTGSELVVTVRDDLDLSDPDPANPARKLAFYDNRVGEIDLRWDVGQMMVDLKEGVDLSRLFSDAELKTLFEAHAFDPDLHPEFASAVYTAEDLAKAEDDLKQAQKRTVPLESVMCSHCGHEFFVESR